MRRVNSLVSQVLTWYVCASSVHPRNRLPNLQPQLLHQPVLQYAVGAFHATLCLV